MRSFSPKILSRTWSCADRSRRLSPRLGRRFALVIVLVASLLVPLAPARAASTWYVAPTGDDRNGCLTPEDACRTIGKAIGKAVSGDTISIDAGTYVETLTIDKNLSLRGDRADATIIDGGGVNTVVTISGNVNAVISAVTIRNGNNPNGSGGGIHNIDGQLTLSDSIVTANHAYSGGGIRSDGGEIVNSTISDNSASNAGGGIEAQDPLELRIVTSTISGNTAGTQGGGIYHNDGDLKLNESTITANRAGGSGDGLFEMGGYAVLSHTILAGNGALSRDCFGQINPQGYNLIGNNAGCEFTPTDTDLVGTNDNPIDAGLGPLQNNGGSTLTHALLAGSPAIDAGSATTCEPAETDQRGVDRPQDGNGDGVFKCDIGAFEVATKAPPWLVLLYLAGDDTPGPQSLSEPIRQLLDRLATMPYNPSMRLVVLYDVNDPVPSGAKGDSRIFERTAGGLSEVTPGSDWIGFPANSELDTGSVSTLHAFIRWARNTYPGSLYTMLSIVDHGGGWAPDFADPGQPGGGGRVQAGGWRGMSLDMTSGGSSLSTRDTGEALKDLGTFDVLFFDACLMGMIESAYEVRDHARYFIAGENLLWSNLPYEQYLAADSLNAATTPHGLASSIVDRYNQAESSQQPFAIAALDTALLSTLAANVDTLAQQLLEAHTAHPEEVEGAIRAAYANTQKFDYDSNYEIDPTDGYVDLADFASKLQTQDLPASVKDAAAAVYATVAGAQNDGVVIRHRAQNGKPVGAAQAWDFSGANGVSIYLPIGEKDVRPTGIGPDNVLAPEPQLAYYTDTNQLAFTNTGAPKWSQLLALLDKNTPTREQARGGSEPFRSPTQLNSITVNLPLIAR